MSGISSTLNIAQGAIAAQQYSLNVTGHNIANVNNPNYSLQEADHRSNKPALYSGFLFGTGVGVDQIKQRVDQLLENRLTDAKSSQAAFQEAEAYLNVVESYFDESSETSINSLTSQFWNSWSNLSINPLGASERVAVFDNASNLAERYSSVNADLMRLTTDLNNEISSSLGQINSITSQIADMNREITGLELGRSANDQRDQRNALVDELGTLMDIDTFEQSNGSIIINAANGFSLVNGVDNYEVSLSENQVMYQGSYGTKIDITDKIQGGKLGGWLDIRDEVIPKYQSDLDVLAENMIWAMNYQHSQGSGLNYSSDPVTGTYESDPSRLLSSLAFGDRIDYEKDFKMWIKDQSGTAPAYRSTEVDMGISEAKLSAWEGTALASNQARYKMTVVEGSTVGDREVAEFDGSGLGTVQAGATVSDALNASIADQTLTIYGSPIGTQKINVRDAGGDALRSAASISEELNKIPGVEAHASKTSAAFALGGVPLHADGDVVKYTLVVDGIEQQQTFTVDSSQGNFQKQFEDSLSDAAESINEINSDDDFSASGLTVTSSSGKNIGVQGFDIDEGAGPVIVDNITFEGENIVEVGAVGNEAAVITGTVTMLHDPGMSFASNVSGPGNGEIFAGGNAVSGSSILTLGGKGGFGDFTVGETISFDLDGHSVSYGPLAGAMTDEVHAAALVTEINNAFVAGGVENDYSVFATGGSVSIVKNKALEEPIEITNFTETGSNDATLRVSTGTGSTTKQPVNDLLESGNAFRDGATSTLYDKTGVIKWEKLDADGFFTGEEGLIDVPDDGRVEIKEQGVTTLSFNINAGSLVAGNTLTINTDEVGKIDPLDFRVRNNANSINDTYTFTVESGGKVGHLPGTGEPPLVINWKNSNGSGSFEIEGSDPPITPDAPVEVDVDGMTLVFSDGTLFDDDVFTITTDSTGKPKSLNEDGKPSGELLSDWHWTLDSFAEQVNRQSPGVKVTVTDDNRLKLEASDSYHDVKNLVFEDGGAEFGFMEANTVVSVHNYANLDFEVEDLNFTRNAGMWTVGNDPTGGNIRLIPEGGDDDGFGVDFSGDGIADIEVKFKNKITDDGFFNFDLAKTDPSELSYAFGDDSGTTAGVMAAAGINTFFSGTDAMTMEVNDKLSDSNGIAAARINSETGEISQGDNSNALKLASLQHKTIDMEVWSFNRGSDAQSNLTSATLDSYYQMMMGSLGIESRSVKSAKQFADIMVNNMTEQRNSISAVSLDEEMINLMKYQHAFGAASKLVTVSDEMLNTLLGMR
jgi:flagellar hook-associated protein 1 FlgK